MKTARLLCAGIILMALAGCAHNAAPTQPVMQNLPARTAYQAGAPVYAPAPTAYSSNAGSPPPASGSVQVWVNTRTGVYHMPGERWYGRTKEGEYMSQSAANAAGYRETENGQ